MAYEKEIALSLTVKAEKYNAGMAKAAKTTVGLEEAARKASKELDQMEKEAEDAARAAGKLASETKKPLVSTSAKAYAIDAARISRAARQAATDTRLLGTAALGTNAQVEAAQKTLVRFRGSLSDISRESQRFRAATTAIRATQPRYIQHSGPEFNHTAEQLQRYARAAASTAGQIAPLEAATTRTARAIAGLRQAAQNTADTLRGPTAQAFATSARGVGDLAVEAGKVAVPIAGISAALATVGLAAIPLGAVAVAMGAFGAAAIRASENIVQLKGSIAAIVAANEKVTDSSGNMLEGVEKIKAVQTQVSAVFKQLQVDALKTSDTTEGLISKFSIALAPGFAQGWSLDQIRKMTVAASVSMSALRIPEQQASSEMRALLTGDELDNSQLAKGLNIFTKADWTKVAEGGKLFENLNERMKDFVVAGGEQSKTLTGILSSLEDFNTKLMALAGNDATETLAKGFGEVLAMVQNTDGSVTPLGQNLIDLAEISGYYVNSVAKDFIWLAKKIAKAGEIAADVARTFQIATMRDKVYEDQKRARAGIAGAPITINGKKMTVDEARGREQRLTAQTSSNLTAPDVAYKGTESYNIAQKNFKQEEKRRYDAAVELGQYRAALKPWQMSLERYDDPNFIETETAARTHKLFTTYDDSDAPSKNTFTPRPLKRSGGAKAAGKKDPRIAETMRKMRNELQASDAKDLGLSGQLKVYEKYLPILKAIKGAETEYTETLENRKLATINLTKKMAELAAATKKEKDELARQKKEDDRGRAQEQRDEETDLNKRAYAIQLSALDARYSAELISTEQYYKERQALQVRSLLEETENKRKSLKADEEDLQGQLAAESKKKVRPAGLRKDGDQDPKVIARLTNEINKNADEQGRNNVRETLGVGAIATETAQERTARARASAKEMIGAGLSEVFSTLNIPMADGVTRAFSHGIQQSLEASTLGKAAETFFGDAFVSDGVFGALKTVGALIADSFAKEAASVQISKGINKQIRELSGDPADALKNRKLDIAEQMVAARKEIEENQPNIVGDILRMSVGMRPASRSDAAARLPELEARLLRQAEDDDSNRQMGAASNWQSRGDLSLDQYLKVLENLPAQTQEVKDEIRRVIKVATEEGAADIEANHAAHAEMLAQIARENDTTAQKIAASWEGASERIQEGFRRIREEQERALNADAIGRDVQNIYGRGSAAENNLATIDARIKAAEAERVAIGTRNRDNTLKQNRQLNAFGSISVSNTSSAAIEDSQSTLFGAYSSRTFSTDANSFVDDITRIQEWVRAGLRVVNADGEVFSELDIPRLATLKTKFAKSKKLVDADNADASELTKLISELKLSKEVPAAEIRQGSKDTARGLGLELEALRAGLTPGTGDDKELAKKQADEEIKKREREYTNAGFLGSGADKESARAIRKNLEEMRSLMYQQIEKDSYTEANPLPVRVVDNRPLFANPDSYYFRQKSVTIAIGDGAIRIDGAKNPGALGPDLLNQLRAIVPDLDRELSRNSNLDANRVAT